MMRRWAPLVVIATLCGLAVTISAPPVAADIRQHDDTGNVEASPSFGFVSSGAQRMPIDFRNASTAVATDWETAVNFNIDFIRNDSHGNKLRWSAVGELGAGVIAAAPQCTPGSTTCYVAFNLQEWPEDDWHTDSSQPTGAGKLDFRGVLTHEWGHWLGIGNCATVPESSPLPSLLPDSMNSMCFKSGPTDKSEQRWPAHEDSAGVNYNAVKRHGLYRWFSVNNNLSRCASSSSSCVPTYWDVDVSGLSSYSTAGNGSIELQTNGSNPVQIMWQRVTGARVDYNNNHVFKLRIKARVASGSTGTIELFVRAFDGSQEDRCQKTIDATYDTYECQVSDADWITWTEYEYGVRVFQDTDVTTLKIRDNDQ